MTEFLLTRSEPSRTGMSRRRAPLEPRGPVVVVALALAVVASSTREAAADGLADEAELRFRLAAECYIKKDFQCALEHFLVSNRLVQNRNVVYNIARTFEQLQRYPDAHRYYVDALAGESDPETMHEITSAMSRIAPNVAVLQIATSPPHATIYIDRRDLGSRGISPRQLALAPGRYRVIVELEGFEPAESEPIDLVLGKTVVLELPLEKIVGTVHVGSNVEAFVRADDENAEPMCRAPCTAQLSPGPHLLFVSRDGYRTQTRQIVVPAKDEIAFKVDMIPLTGSVLVSTDERDALVEIDGRTVGFSPVIVPNVPVGVRHVRVSLRGYRTIEREITVHANQQTDLLDLGMVPVREVTAASRFAESIEDAPSSVSILSAQELRAFAYPTIAEALRGVRGIYVSHDGVYSSIGVRGLGQPNDYGNRLLVLSDGMPMNDNIVYSSYVGYDGRTDMFDVERIEVVRGPGSLLYGTGAVSGVVNLISRGRDAPSSIHLGIGTADNAVAMARGGFNVRIDDETGIWTSVTAGRSDGRTVPFQIDDGSGARAMQSAGGVDKFSSGTLTGRSWWGPLTAQWFYTTRDLAIPFGAYGVVFNDPRSRLRDTRGMGELRFEPRLSKETQLLLRAHVNTYDYDGDFFYPEDVSAESYAGKWFGGEGRLVWTPVPERDLRISVGGEAQIHAEASLLVENRSEGASSRILDVKQPFHLEAVYALFDATPLEWLHLSLGGRLDVYSSFGATFNPRAAFIFRPSERDVVKLLGGRAFRAPSVYEQYYDDGGQQQVAGNSAGATLAPETAYSAEVEYSRRFSDDWIGLAAVHATYVDHIIETRGDGTPDSLLQYANSAIPVVTTGADIEVRREWRVGWMLSASYSVQLAQYTDPPPSGETGSTRITNAPIHLASLRGVAPIIRDFVSAALRLTLEAPRRISLASDETTRTGFVADVVISGEIARFGVQYSAGLYNLFDWQLALPVAEGFASSTIPQNGRTLLLRVIATF